MGISGLTAFVNNEFCGWEHQVLKGYLVIDGSSLCYSLYEGLRWNQGGEYPQYRALILDMFNALVKAGVRPVVIFDGVDWEGKKTATVLRRRQDSVKFISKHLTKSIPSSIVLPLLSEEVLQLTLKEMSIPFYVVDGEADDVIVEVANFYDCPVLGMDSDYFIFNIHGGYISLHSFCWSTQPISCKVFHLSKFLEKFAIQQEDLRFIIPAVIGNDFLPNVHGFFQYLNTDGRRRSESRVAQLVRCLRQYSTVEEFLMQVKDAPCARKLRDNYSKAREMYTRTMITDPESLSTSSYLKSSQGEDIPLWIIRLYRHGDFSKHSMYSLVLNQAILKICPDVPRKRSSHFISLPVRQKKYHLLGISSVKEYVRQSSESLSPLKVDCLPVFKDSSQLPLSPYPLKVLYDVLDCPGSSLKGLGDEWKLVAMVTKYWANCKVAGISSHLIDALIACQVVCYTCSSSHLNELRRQIECSSTARDRYKWETALHAFSQWQCCYLDAISVNQLVSPSLRVISPALLYDGTIALSLAESSIPVTQSGLPIDLRLYGEIRSIVVCSSTSTSVKKSLQKQASREKSQPKSVAVKKPPQIPFSPFAHKNPFSALHLSASESDSD